jgi:hypothetical protein
VPPTVPEDDDWCSVAEAARRLGVTPTTIRNRIKRHTLETKPHGNQGWLVRVPKPLPSPVTLTVSTPLPERLGEPVTPGAEGTIKALEEHIQTLRALLDESNAAHAAEVARLIETQTQLQDELQEARAEADHAKSDQVRMARDVANMFDDMRTMADRHAELHTDRARLQAELESARARIIDLQAESAQVRKEVADERVHSGTLINQFERVHREHRTDIERERRLIGR